MHENTEASSPGPFRMSFLKAAAVIRGEEAVEQAPAVRTGHQ